MIILKINSCKNGYPENHFFNVKPSWSYFGYWDWLHIIVLITHFSVKGIIFNVRKLRKRSFSTKIKVCAVAVYLLSCLIILNLLIFIMFLYILQVFHLSFLSFFGRDKFILYYIYQNLFWLWWAHGLKIWVIEN